MDIQKTNFVYRCLKMPHVKMVGYFNVDGEKVYCAIKDMNECFFNVDQQEIVEKNMASLTLNNFVELPRAIVNESELVIGDSKLKCSVLSDGRRVIKDESLFQALDRSRKGETRIDGFPPIIGSKTLANLFNTIYPENIGIISPFEVAQFNGVTGKWYDATAIPILCDLYLEAEKRKLIIPQQEHVLEQAKILLRSLARVGITALIDEATNYQEVRGSDALQLLLAQFISEELRPYSSEFPREYFENLFRLYGLPYDPTTTQRPRYFSRFNIKYVYEMLPPQVWDRLDEMNPTIWNENKKRFDRKYHIHRHLNENGLERLREHLNQLIPVMKLSTNIEHFKANFKIVFSDKLKVLERMKNESQLTLEEWAENKSISN